MEIEERFSARDLHQFFKLNEDTGDIIWRERSLKWFKSAGAHKTWNGRYANRPALSTPKDDGALHGAFFGKYVLAHRIVFALVNGHWPIRVVDHINGDPADNRPCNLRDVEQRENLRNSKLARNNKSGCSGVSWHNRDRRWAVRVAGKYLGSFKNRDDAIQARKSAERSMGFHPNHGRAPA